LLVRRGSENVTRADLLALLCFIEHQFRLVRDSLADLAEALPGIEPATVATIRDFGVLDYFERYVIREDVLELDFAVLGEDLSEADWAIFERWQEASHSLQELLAKRSWKRRAIERMEKELGGGPGKEDSEHDNQD
jgi:hypothetical protein